MIIIFGTREKEVTGERINNIKCDNCSRSIHDTIGIMRYFHIYWIPIFLTSRQTIAQCSFCKRRRMGNEFTQDIHTKLKNKLFPISAMLPMFFGPLIILIIITFMILALFGALVINGA